MIEKLDIGGGRVAAYRVSGRVGNDEHDRIIEEAERLIDEHGRIRLLVVLEGFHGWDPSSQWEDFRFGMEHRDDFERVAVVGESRWQGVLASLVKPFFPGELRYFPHAKIDAAREWICADA